MRRWSNDLKVGVMVVIGGILFAILLTMASNWSLGTPGRELTLRFSHLQNIKKGAHVHLAGVSIGKAIGIRLDESGYGEVKVRIEPPFEMRQGMTAELQTLGLVGETIVSLANGDPSAPPLDWSDPIIGSSAMLADMIPRLNEAADRIMAFLDAAEQIGDSAQKDLESASEAAEQFMSGMSEKTDALLRQTGAVSEQLSAALSALEALDRLPELMAQAQTLMAQAQEALQNASSGADRTFQEASAALEETRGELKSVANDIRQTLDSAQRSLNAVDQTTERLQNDLSTAVGDASEALESSQTRVRETMGRLDSGLADIQRFAQRLDKIAADLEAGKGSLGRLMTDEQLADAAAAAAKRVEELADAAAELVTVDAGDWLSAGAEVGYRSASESLQSEAFLRWNAGASRRLLAGVASRESSLLYSAALEQRFGPLWGRFGVIDSKAALGVDWRPKERWILRIEALDAEADKFQFPQIDAEAGLPLWNIGMLILGGENLTEEERGFRIGIRARY